MVIATTMTTDMTTVSTEAMLEIKQREHTIETIVHPNQFVLMTAIISITLRPIKSRNKNPIVERTQKQDLLKTDLRPMKRVCKLHKSSASEI